MIAIKRDRTDTLVSKKYKGTGKLAWDEKLLVAKRAVLGGAIAKIQFDSTYWTEAKAQLENESCGKCAYCEAPTNTVAHGDVEHYRPKSIYWWLAYTYDNYLYACQICNQIYKSDLFPINSLLFPAPPITASTSDAVLKKMIGNISPDPVTVTGSYSYRKFLKNHKAEKALLINPYYENPEPYLAYQADDTLKEVKVIAPNLNNAPFTQAMIDNFGLNRTELLRLRYGIFQTFRLIKVASKRNDLPADFIVDLKKEVEIAQANGSPFAGMIRFFDKLLG